MTEEEKVIKRNEAKVFTSRIRSLKSKLFKALDNENYERAAVLRDQIKEVQSDLMSLLITP